MFLVAVSLSIMFFTLVRQDGPVRPPVIERRANQKQQPYE
jgi:hypothetical protein